MISIAFAVITALVSIFNLPTTARDFSPGPVREICEPSRLRTVTVSATTKAGASIDNLRSEDLTLSENKTPREILKLESAREQPLSIAILIDTSASQERTLEGTKLAAREFVQSILRADRDRAAVISFTDKITLEQDLTNDLTKLQAAIGRVRFVPPLGYLGRLIVGPPPRNPQHLPGATALWDAIADTVKTLQNEKDSRRVIVILTDGEDTFSRATLRDAAQQAAVNNVAVIAIGIADEKKFSLNREQLQKLADETGGRAFFPRKVLELDQIFMQTSRELESQYALSYCAAAPEASGKPLKIQIAVKNPALVQSKLHLSYPHYAF